MRAGEFLIEEERLLDPEEYGLELPVATVRRIVTAVMAQVDPSAVVKVRQSPEGYYLVSTDNEMLVFDFGITADGGEISANIVNAYSSYKGAGVVTKIIDLCFKAMAKKYGRPTKFVISTQEDRGHGVWQAMAQKLGAEWGGSAMESLTERAEQARDAIENIVTMGNIDDYFVRFTDVDKVGYSAHQDFGRMPDVGSADWNPDALPKKKGRPALWFYPASYYLKNKNLFADSRPYVWLVKRRPTAYLQPTQGATRPEAPAGMTRAGLMHKESGVPMAIFFRPEFDVVDRWHEPKRVKENFANGKVKGKSRPGRVKKAGASCSGSVTSLRAKAKKSGGERGKMYHWCANMKSGRNKK